MRAASGAYTGSAKAESVPPPPYVTSQTIRGGEPSSYPMGFEVDRETGVVTVYQGLRHVTLDESQLMELLKAVQS